MYSNLATHLKLPNYLINNVIPPVHYISKIWMGDFLKIINKMALLAAKGGLIVDQIKIGLFLKELRKEKSLTQEQLAEQLNTSNRTISRWETGNNMPDLSMLITQKCRMQNQ